MPLVFQDQEAKMKVIEEDESTTPELMRMHKKITHKMAGEQSWLYFPHQNDRDFSLPSAVTSWYNYADAPTLERVFLF